MNEASVGDMIAQISKPHGVMEASSSLDAFAGRINPILLAGRTDKGKNHVQNAA